MYSKRLAIAAAAGLMVALVLSGCGRGTFATVNGEKITKDEFYRKVERAPTPDGRGGFGQAGPVTLEQMIIDKLWEQLAKEKGVSPTEQQINKRIEFEKKYENLAAVLGRQGITLDEHKKDLRAQLARINVITKGINVPEKDIREAYDRSKDKQPITRPEQVKIGAIICAAESNAKKAYDRIKQGIDFSTVASTMSEDATTRREKGVLGWVWRGQPGVPPILIDAAFKLKVNDISQPLAIEENGKVVQWVILKALDRRPKTVVSFADMKDQIREALAIAKARRQTDFNAMLDAKLKKSKIRIYSDRYKGVERFLEEAKKSQKSGAK